MKVIYSLIGLICFSINVFSQNLKVNQADSYFNSYRFSEATPIYKELIEKDKIKVDLYESAYRNAIISAEKSRDFNFAFSTMGLICNLKSFNSEDAFHYFQLSLLTANYAKAKELLFKGIVINQNGSQVDLAKIYFNGKIWDEIAKDTSKFKIQSEVEFNSGRGDFGAMFHPNGIVFSSARDLAAKEWSFDNSSFLDLYLYTKDKKVETLKFLRSARHDGTAYYDSLNKLWYFARNLEVKNKSQLTTTGLFIYDEKTKKEIPFKFNSDSVFIAQPYLSDNGNTLWFSSNRKGGKGNADIWYCKRVNNEWSEPINAGDIINTSQNEMFPFFQKNNLYFASNGHAGLGGLDLFSVKFENGIASNIKNLGAGINSNADDFSLIIDNSGQLGYVSSNRNDFIDHIYDVKIKAIEFVLKGDLIVDVKEGLEISKLPIIVKQNGQVLDTLYADIDGKFEFKTDKNEEFTIEINNDRFFPVAVPFSTIGKTESDTTFQNLNLNSKFVTVNAVVVDEKTNKPLPNSKVTIKDPKSGVENVFVTNEKGSFKTELERNNNYLANSSHKGYFDGTTNISTQTKDLAINKEIELKFIAKGSTIAVENIFYDYGKSTLRTESKVELDKLAVFLKENPKMKVELSAHTDSRGGDARNLVLSQQRAQSCVDYLISVGVNKNFIVAKGYGETKLINRCKNDVKCTEEEHQKNRRTEIKVL